MAKRPGGVMVQGAELTRSQLIPVLTKWEELGKKAQLWPMLFCILTFFAMTTFGSTDTIMIPIATRDGRGFIDPRGWIYTSNMLIIVAIFLTMASLYFIYRIVGKDKSWWILLAAMAFTGYYLWLFKVYHYFGWMYDFFYMELAGGEPSENMPFLQLFLRHFLGTGFFEETVKALPALALVVGARYMSPSLRAKIGIEEPLDGILIGAAAGGGFALMETLIQYVPQYLVDRWLVLALAFHGVKPGAMDQTIASLNGNQLLSLIQTGSGILGTDPGMTGLIIRSIDLAFGHMAYAGYFGYFIGLSVLKPQKRWKILLIGLISASIPHALWDSIQGLHMPPLEAACAVLSYAILGAAILKAREISPNRNLLQPSVIFGAQLQPAGAGASAAPRVSVAPAYAPSPVPMPPQAGPVAMPLPVPEPFNSGVSGNGNRLRIGAKFLVIVPGLRLLEHQVPGLLAQSGGGGEVAEVTRNPKDPSVLGLTNLSTTGWEVVSGGGTRRQILTGQTIKLAPGTKIDFGSTDGEVS